MTEKSHVAIGAEICPVCLEPHNEVVLLNKTMQATLPSKVSMGWALCPLHQAQKEEGYIHLVEVTKEVHTLDEAATCRTGRTVSIRKTAWAAMINTEVPANSFSFGFVPVGFIEKVEQVTGNLCP